MGYATQTTAAVLVDWSTGINPSGWSVFTVKKAYYIDYGLFYMISAEIEGTGTGTTAGIVLPIAPSSTVYGSTGPVYLGQIANTNGAAGIFVGAGGSTAVTIFPTANGGAWTNGAVRTARLHAIIFK